MINLIVHMPHSLQSLDLSVHSSSDIHSHKITEPSVYRIIERVFQKRKVQNGRFDGIGV